jgi:tetratricopeptide (TPR) repeat protein
LTLTSVCTQKNRQKGSFADFVPWYNSFADEGSPKVWNPARNRKPQLLSLLILSGIIFAGCQSKTIRVAVTDQNIKRSIELAQAGDIAFSRKDNYSALIKYLEAVLLNPNNEYFLNRLGLNYVQLNLYDEARRAFQRALDLNPKLSFAWNNLGSMYFFQRKLKRAEKYFKKAISLKPDEASFHLNLAKLYLDKKKNPDAKAEWNKAIALDPGALNKSSGVGLTVGGTPPMKYYYYIACFFASTGSVEPAIENLQLAYNNGFSDFKAIEKEPDFNPIRQNKRFVEFMKELTLQIKLRDSTRAKNHE